ncbi:MAG: PadR family transcriptional regulator [Chloroflexia bacterium]|nr:PadR family transcriptional regulator [Chloroflexia bacterium]
MAGRKATTAATPGGMTPEHALLGVLAATESGSGHGYDLARSFAPGAPLGSVLHLEAGMIYHHVKKLERLGWLRLISDGGRRPGRRTVAITDEGRAELRRWLAEPVHHTREVRLEFRVKLFLALRLEEDTARRLVREQRALLAGVQESFSYEPMPTPGTGQEFGALVRDLRAMQTEAADSWLEHVQERLDD